jgi:hypothetical protein
MNRVSRLALVVAVLATVQVSHAGAAYAASSAAERQFVDLINQDRAASGKPALAVHPDLVTVARNWTDSMIADGKGCGGSLVHNPDYTEQYPSGWTRAAENVACGQSVESLHRALMSSSGHRANILGDFNQIGVGVSVDSRGTMWVTQNFMKHPDRVPDGGGGDRPATEVPVLSVADASRAEGDSDRSKLVFTVTLSAATDKTVTVAYATANGTADGSDYKAKSGTLTFKPGKTRKNVSVTVRTDTTPEVDETLTLTLSSAANASIGDGVASGVILDDD